MTNDGLTRLEPNWNGHWELGVGGGERRGREVRQGHTAGLRYLHVSRFR